MDENKQEVKNKVEDKEPAPADAGKGDQPKTLTLYEQTNASAKRVEEANKKTEELLNRQEKLYEIQKLSGDGGGRVESEPVSEEKKKVNDAAEYFKGTQLEKDIKKANE